MFSETKDTKKIWRVPNWIENGQASHPTWDPIWLTHWGCHCTKKAMGQHGKPTSSHHLKVLSSLPAFPWLSDIWEGGRRKVVALSLHESPGVSGHFRQSHWAVHCALFQRAASSPFVYHTSCLPFCLLHTSSPSLIVPPLPVSPFGPLDFRLTMGNSNYLKHKKIK